MPLLTIALLRAQMHAASCLCALNRVPLFDQPGATEARAAFERVMAVTRQAFDSGEPPGHVVALLNAGNLAYARAQGAAWRAGA